MIARKYYIELGHILFLDVYIACHTEYVCLYTQHKSKIVKTLLHLFEVGAHLVVLFGADAYDRMPYSVVGDSKYLKPFLACRLGIVEYSTAAVRITGMRMIIGSEFYLVHALSSSFAVCLLKAKSHSTSISYCSLTPKSLSTSCLAYSATCKKSSAFAPPVLIMKLACLKDICAPPIL